MIGSQSGDIDDTSRRLREFNLNRDPMEVEDHDIDARNLAQRVQSLVNEITNMARGPLIRDLGGDEQVMNRQVFNQPEIDAIRFVATDVYRILQTDIERQLPTIASRISLSDALRGLGGIWPTFADHFELDTADPGDEWGRTPVGPYQFG